MRPCHDCQKTLDLEKFLRSEYRCGHIVCHDCKGLSYQAPVQLPLCPMCQATVGAPSSRHLAPVPGADHYLSGPWGSSNGSLISKRCWRHSNNPANLVCLNEECAERVDLCTTCVALFHSNCDASQVKEVSELFKRVKFPVPSFPSRLKTDQLKATVSRELQQLGQVLEGIIDEFDNILQKEYEFLEKMAGNLSFFASNLDSLTISVKPPDRIRAVLTHQQRVEEFAADVSTVFNHNFWWAFRKTVTDFWVQQLPLIASFRSDTVQRHQTLLSNICRFDFFVLTSIALHNFQLGPQLKLEEVLRQMVESMKVSENPFQVVDAEGLDPAEISILRKQFWDALFQSPHPTFVGIQRYLTTAMAKSFPGQKVAVRFNRRGMLLQGPRHSKFARYGFLDFVYQVIFMN